MRWLARAGRRVLRGCGIEVPPRRPGRLPPDFSPEDIAVVREVAPYTMTSPERIFALCRAVEYLVAHRIPGDIVECGVWRGGSMMAVARTLLRLGDRGRSLYLFDTFEGMPPPTGEDRDLDGRDAAALLGSEDRRTSWIWAHAPLEGVRVAVGGVGYDPGRVHFVPGRVEETLPGRAPEVIALLRLDTDWYESTYHELATLYDRLAVGGVLIIDDYGHWRGARRAVDRFLAERRPRLLLNRIDYTGRIGVKLDGATGGAP